MSKIFSSAGNFIGASLLGILILINGFSGIIAGVWLLILGGWSELLTGFLYSLVMPFGYSLLALPSLLLMPLILRFSESGNKIMIAILGFLNVAYSNLIILFWTFFIFSIFVINAGDVPAIPAVLWAYAVVMGPLGYMAKKEGDDNIGTTLGLFLAQLCFVALLVLWLLDAPIEIMWWGIGLIGLVFSIYVTTLAVSFIQKPVSPEPLPDFFTEDETQDTNEFESITQAEIIGNNKFCTNCDEPISSEANFCRACGNKLI